MGKNLFVLTLLILLTITTIIYLFVIPLLKHHHIEQIIRSDGPKAHLRKSHTPIFGGILIVLGTVISFLLLIIKNPLGIRYSYHQILILIIPFLSYFFIGLIDDIKIVKKKQNEGLTPAKKFLLQLIFSVFTFAFYLSTDLDPIVNLFGLKLNLGFGYGIFLMFIYLSMTNAVNFTDGLDGLAGGISLIALGAFGFIAISKGRFDLLYFISSLFIMIVVYLLFNLPKAKIFMGDSGSLAIGAAFSSIAILLKTEVLLLIIGFIFFLEAVSVVLQICYFKITKGQRILKMAPFHHHLELSGFTEWQIDLILWSVSLVMGLLGIAMGVRIF